jgi:hypothetical protein
MKVIAKCSSRTFLVEATAEELDALAGRKIGDDTNRWDNNSRNNAVGQTFNICEAWRRLNRDTRRKKEVALIKPNLQHMINGLDMLEPFVDEPPLPVQPETTGEGT